MSEKRVMTKAPVKATAILYREAVKKTNEWMMCPTFFQSMMEWIAGGFLAFSCLVQASVSP